MILGLSDIELELLNTFLKWISFFFFCDDAELSLEEGSAGASDDGSTVSAVAFVLLIEQWLVDQKDVLAPSVDEVLHLLVWGATTAVLCGGSGGGCCGKTGCS